jgi:5S rRNA maturation endonuclease (ribonuclease M5)
VASCPNPVHRGDVSKNDWNNWIFKKNSIPSWGIIDNPNRENHGSHHCHACKFGGGIWELGAIIWGISIEEAGKKIYELFNKPTSIKPPIVSIKIPRKKKIFELPTGVVIPGKDGNWFAPALKYLNDRGITREQCDRWGLGYAVKGKLRLRVVFPVYTEGCLRTYSARSIVPSARRYMAGEEKLGAEPMRSLFGEQFFDRSLDMVTVAEGCPSVLALERAGAPNPCGMLGSYYTPYRAKLISQFKNILIATDPDQAGEKVARWISMASRRSRVIRLNLSKSPDDESISSLAQKIKKALVLFS